MLEPERRAPGPQLTGFTAAGGFKVDGAVYPHGLLLTVARAADWAPPPLAALAVAALDAILDPHPEFVLLGTGAAQAQPPAGLRATLDGRGIGIEAMDSRAAARLWGVLRAEGRTVAAAFYPLGG